MFQLYKRRDFSAFVGDTFSFFKIFSKNYFKNYFIINGGFILILIVALFLFMKFFYQNIFFNFNQRSENFILKQMEENVPLFIIIGLVLFLTIIMLSLINYLYPVSYLKLIETNQETTLENLTQFMKKKIGKSLLFFILTLFTFIPIILIGFILSMFLIFIIIGIPIMLIFFPAMISWVAFSYYDYISTDNGFFTSFGIGFNILTKKFWPIVGSTVIMYIIIQVIVGIVYFIPYIIGMVSLFANPENLQNSDPNQLPEGLNFMMIMMAITMLVTIVFSYTLQNLLLINQGIMYYSAKEDAENNAIKSEIDLIGSSNE